VVDGLGQCPAILAIGSAFTKSTSMGFTLICPQRKKQLKRDLAAVEQRDRGVSSLSERSSGGI
jgi:hypothetical protein